MTQQPPPGAGQEWRGSQRIAHTWSESDRFIPRQLVRPALRLMQLEVSGAVAMAVAAALALLWANSPWGGSYAALWDTPVEISIGELHLIHLSARLFVNDGLMTIFFLLVAMEIKRELIFGELRDRRAAALPVIAALGGMIVPAGIYAAFNAGGPAASGWGIPMATDIAFAVAVVTLAGSRVPPGARLFLLTLAIADDLGAIVVIAVFYAGGLDFFWLAAAVATVIFSVMLRRAHVRSMPVFVVLGLIGWWCLHSSGVHSTIIGVALGFVTPAWSFLNPEHYPPVARELVARVEASFGDRVLTHDEHAANHSTLREISRLTIETMAPLDRIELRLAKWSAFVIVPVFAFANAGVVVPRVPLGEWLTDPVVLGVGVGLVVGKTVGVFGATWLAVRFKVGRAPAGVTNLHLLGIAIIAGVGFTVAMFVASLSFPGDEMTTDMAKLGILIGSTVAAIAGYLFLRFSKPGADRPSDGDEQALASDELAPSRPA